MEPGWRWVRGAVLGLALFGLLAHALALLLWPVPAVLLPLSVAVGVFLAGVALPAALPGAGTPPRWLTGLVLAVTAFALAVVAHGAVATVEREWDGVVSWGLRARVLADPRGLDQPFFTDPGVYHHSRAYPLLQPFALAAMLQLLGNGGRILFPLLHMLLAALAGLAVARRGAPQGVALLAAVGVALLPALVGNGGDGVDSGYAELLMTLALSGVLAALLLDDHLLLGAAAFLLPLAKPEGTVYAAALVALTTWTGPRARHGAATLGATLAFALWLPLQQRLTTFAAPGPVPALAALGVGALALAAGELRARLTPRTVALFGGIALLVGVAAIAWLLPWLRTRPDVLVAQYLGGADRLPARLMRLPEILGGLLAQGLHPRHFGTCYLLLTALALTRRRIVGRCPSRPALAFLGCGLLTVVAAFLLSPEPDVRHHLRSSATRLLLHWAVPAWLLATAWLAERLLDAAHAPRWLIGGTDTGRR